MKIDRLLAITILLLNRKKIRAKELAERFEVSLKTIYRDMESLAQAGIPLYAEQGVSGGYALMESFSLTRQVLSLEELKAMLAAVKGIHAVLDEERFARLLDKVTAMVGQPENQAIREPVVYDLNPWGQGPTARQRWQQWRSAITEAHRVRIVYRDRHGGKTERVVEPAELLLKGTVWYVHAYCGLRKEFRMFRLSRIVELEVLTELFERRHVPIRDAYNWEAEWSEGERNEVLLLIEREARWQLGDLIADEAWSEREDGRLQAKEMFKLDDWFYGKILSLGNRVQVIEPLEAAKEVKRRAEQIWQLYT